LITGLSVGISPLARHFLKHAIDCANMEVHMLIEASSSTELQHNPAQSPGILKSAGALCMMAH
jgi:hypothetical protein